MAYKRISPITVAEGGTGAQTLTSHGVLLGNGTSAISAVAVGTTGQVLTGVTGSAPTFQSPASGSITITGDTGGGLTGSSFTFTGGSTGLSFGGSGSTETVSGTLIVGNGGTGVATMTTAYAPVCAGTTATGNLQVASSGLSNSGYVLTSTGASSLPTWQAASSGGVTYSVITSNQTAAVNNGYICNSAGTLALALPSSSAVGSIIEVTGMNNATGWQITQGTGQQIFFGTSSTTSGASGSLTSSATYDAVRIVCNVANTSWIVLSSIGNITVV